VENDNQESSNSLFYIQRTLFGLKSRMKLNQVQRYNIFLNYFVLTIILSRFLGLARFFPANLGNLFNFEKSACCTTAF